MDAITGMGRDAQAWVTAHFSAAESANETQTVVIQTASEMSGNPWTCLQSCLHFPFFQPVIALEPLWIQGESG